jgi:hypothetical protein
MEQTVLSSRLLWRVDRVWWGVAKIQLGYHDDALRAVWPRWQSQYSPLMKRLVAEALEP